MASTEQPTDRAAAAELKANRIRLAERMLVAGVAICAMAVGLWDYRAGLAVLGASLTLGGLIGMRNHAG